MTKYLRCSFLFLLVYSLSTTAQNLPTNSRFTVNDQQYTSGIQFLPIPGSLGGAVLKNSLETKLLADSSHGSRYDTIALSYKLTTRTYFTYDSGGMLVYSLNKSVDKNGNWKNYSSDTLNYVGSQLRLITNRQWDSQLGAWKNALRYDYFYDTLNVLQSIIISNWSTTLGNWLTSEKQSYTYNSSNQVTTELLQTFNSSLNSWENNSRFVYTYVSGKASKRNFELWEALTQSWLPSSMEEYTYNGSGLRTGILAKEYNSSSGSWVDTEKYALTYTTAGLTETNIMQTWNGAAWTNAIQLLYTYQDEQVLTKTIQHWSAGQSAWVNFQLDENYFSQHEVFGIQEISKPSILLPNPLQGGSVVELMGLAPATTYQIQLFSLNGKICLDTNVRLGETITIPHLTEGIYLLKASSSKSGIQYQKLLITNR